MLAVAITEPQDWLAPDEESRRLLAEHLDLLGNLVSSPATMMCRQLGACEAVVEGVWGLAEGLEVGRDLEIRHALEQMLVRAVRRLDASAPVLYGSYAHDPESSGVRVLVQHAHRPEEHHYPDYSTGEGLAGFRKILDAAVAARVPAGTSHDYRIKARASGLSWVGQDPMGDEDAGEDANTRPD
jgi:hypothetical protein